MKFGALLRTSAGEVPELQELFAAYKQLKKHLKRLPERNALAGGAAAISEADARALGATEADFVAALSADVARFNDMFLEREEDAVIRLRSLEDDAVASATAADLKDVYRRFVDFHGEMLLLVHWSILAYTGMVKILKKHHKRTGLLVRAPHLDNLVGQPFCSTELMSERVRKTEVDIDAERAERLPFMFRSISLMFLWNLMPQLMSELVRKAERDIDALRARLAAVGTAPLASTATSQSAMLLQVARDRNGAAGAAGLLAAASDSGSAPSGEEGATTDEASDAETARGRADGDAAEPSGAAGGGSAASPGGRRKRRAAELDVNGGSGGGAAAEAANGGASSAADGADTGPAPKQQRVGGGGATAARHSASAAAGGPAAMAAAAAAAMGRRQQPASSGSGSGNRAAPAAVTASTGARQAQRLAGPPAADPSAADPVTGGTPHAADAAQSLPAAATVAAAAAPSAGAAGASPQHRQPPSARPQPQGQPRPARILAQTQAALGLWKELTETASTPSTVLPVQRGLLPVQYAASSVTTDQSAA